MTWLDWIALAMALGFALQGMLKGVVAALLGAVAVVVAYVGAAIVLPHVGGYLVVGTPLPAEWARLIGFLLSFSLFYLLLAVLISIMPGAKRPGSHAQTLGIFAGLLKAAAVAMAGVGILLASPLTEPFRKDVDRSVIVQHLGTMQQSGIQQLRKISPVTFEPIGPDARF